MNKKYKITSKFRFITSMAILAICLITLTSTLLGLNTANSSSMKQYNQVLVEAGDTIWDIASEYTTDSKDVREIVYDICQINDTNAEKLEAGERILIPVYDN